MATSSKSRRSSKSVVAKTSSGKTAIVRTGSKAEAKYKAQGATFSSDAGTLGSAREASKERTRARSLADPMTVLENAGGTVPSYTPPPTISSTTLTPAPDFNLPTAPAVGNAGKNAMTSIGAVASQTPAGTGTPAPSADTPLQTYLKSIAKPESTGDIYAKAEEEAGVQQKQQAVAGFQNQLNAIVAKSQADKLSLVGQGRGVTEAIIGGQQAQIDREAAIQSLPIAAQLSAAQGDLEMAKEHVNTLFTIRSQDATNRMNYKNKVAEAVYNYATDQQKTALDERRRREDKDFTLLQNTLNYAQSLATSAIANGQPSVASRIMALDPNSKTYAQDVASAARGIVVAQKSGGGSNSYSVEMTPEDRRALVGAGFSVDEIAAIERDVPRLGIDAVLATEGLTPTEKAAISKVYGASVPLQRWEINTATTQKFAADALKNAYTTEQLHAFAKAAGFGGWNFDSKEKEVEKYLNSEAARQKYVDEAFAQQ